MSHKNENANEVTLYVSSGLITCLTVPRGHLPVRIVDTDTGQDAYFETGHTENVDRFFPN